MIQLTAIVDGKRSVMLTGESIEEAERSCRDRFGARFEGFGPIPTETKARAKWAEYRAKAVTRDELEAWLNALDRMDRRTIKRMYASEGGR